MPPWQRLRAPAELLPRAANSLPACPTRSFATRTAMRSRYGSSDARRIGAWWSANPGAERVAHGELQLRLGRDWRAGLLVRAVVGVAAHPQPLERQAPVAIRVEQPGRGEGVPALAAVGLEIGWRWVDVDSEPVVTRAQSVPAEALRQQGELRLERPRDRLSARCDRGLAGEALHDSRPAGLALDAQPRAVEARVPG